MFSVSFVTKIYPGLNPLNSKQRKGQFHTIVCIVCKVGHSKPKTMIRTRFRIYDHESATLIIVRSQKACIFQRISHLKGFSTGRSGILKVSMACMRVGPLYQAARAGGPLPPATRFSPVRPLHGTNVKSASRKPACKLIKMSPILFWIQTKKSY